MFIPSFNCGLVRRVQLTLFVLDFWVKNVGGVQHTETVALLSVCGIIEPRHVLS
jgi:hypothetical protein